MNNEHVPISNAPSSLAAAGEIHLVYEYVVCTLSVCVCVCSPVHIDVCVCVCVYWCRYSCMHSQAVVASE